MQLCEDIYWAVKSNDVAIKNPTAASNGDKKTENFPQRVIFFKIVTIYYMLYQFIKVV